mgnify:CR=1 FL=1
MLPLYIFQTVQIDASLCPTFAAQVQTIRRLLMLHQTKIMLLS